MGVLNRCLPKSIFEQVFFHTDGQQAHKKMLNIVNHQRSSNQNHNEISPHSCQNQFGSVQSHSSVQLFATPRTAASQASLSIPNSWSLLKLMSMEQMMPSNHLILCRPLLLLPSIFSSIRVCFNESVFHIKQPKFWNFSFSISPSNKYLALISFRIDGFDLLAVQGTLKSLLNTCQNGCHQKEQMLVRMQRKVKK